ncbi:MAG: methyltransferase domain-containing protein [Desulfovermiculus sp.]|nr:methyltransferase domain-containing protein [Desulfovermiculus sp.]
MERHKANKIMSYESIIEAMYHGILGRKPDSEGFNCSLKGLVQGQDLDVLIKDMIKSDEFRSKYMHLLLNNKQFLPDLTKQYPKKYKHIKSNIKQNVFLAYTENDFRFIESIIGRYRYYDSLDVWSTNIDLDKKVIAAMVKTLGAKSCIELGCFTGPVLSQLLEEGVDVCGVDISHLAFVLAYSNIYEKLYYGDLLELNFEKKFDIFLAMDIIEHLNPFDISKYVNKMKSLIYDNGYIILNSPMFGNDDIFGTVFDVYLTDWRNVDESSFWYTIPCDTKGWPQHGHLIWASPIWWEETFRKHGLVRDRDIEIMFHNVLDSFFSNFAPARRSFFILKKSNHEPDLNSIYKNINTFLGPLLNHI